MPLHYPFKQENVSLPFEFDNWLSQSGNIRHRQFIVVRGEEQWGLNAVALMLDKLGTTENESLWVNVPKASNSVNDTEFRHFLGQEWPSVIYNAHRQLRASALFALSGVVSRHGIMVLLTPNEKEWPVIKDLEIDKRVSYGWEQQAYHGNFKRWLNHCIRQNPNVAILTPEQFIPPASHLTPNITEFANLTYLSEQNHAIEQIQALTLRTHHNLVLTADRGRGKSSALGIAAANLLQQGKSVVVTAPRRETLQQFFKFADALSHRDPTQQLFYAIDRLLAERPSVDVLMIDEAASFPAELLQKVVRLYPNIVFSTTIHGYEGSGRGFQTRFLPFLDKLDKTTEIIHLEQPIRWYKHDPLEAFWFDAMLMKCENTRSINFSTSDWNAKDISVKKWQSDELLCNADIFQQLFTLLVTAHYQTTPDDIVKLLESAELSTYTLQAGDLVLGVALVINEGGSCLTELADAIIQGTRRPSGHLTPQSLTSMFLEPEWTTYRYLRITRIAVHPDTRRSGLASHLINYIRSDAIQLGYQFLSTSFGATNELVNFWVNNAFFPIKIGQKIDASSGERSVLMLNNLNDDARALLPELQSRFRQDFLFQAPRVFKDMCPYLVSSLSTFINAGFELTETERNKLSLIAASKGPVYAYTPLLDKLRNHVISSDKSPASLDMALLTAITLLGWDDNKIADYFGYPGKKMVSGEVKTVIKRLLNH